MEVDPCATAIACRMHAMQDHMIVMGLDEVHQVVCPPREAAREHRDLSWKGAQDPISYPLMLVSPVGASKPTQTSTLLLRTRAALS